MKHRGIWGRIAGFFTLCGSLAAAGAACAQEQAANAPEAAKDELQEIVVTGTLIRGIVENFPLEDHPISSIEDHRISPV